MRRIWAPWRSEYVTNADEQEGCFLCRALGEGAARHRENLVVCEAPRGLVILNRYPYGGGHVLVAPRAHAGAPEDLGAEDARALDGLLRATIRAVRAEYRPDGLNVGMNLGRVAGAGVPDHCHWHVVPRWSGDTNFMPVVGDTKVLPESLDRTWERLRPHFAGGA